MKNFLFGLAAVVLVSACAKGDTFHTPTSLPDNWVAEYPATYTGHIEKPAVMTANSEATSLWSSSPQSLFGDRRASQAGDILTVTIEINDEAEFKNSVTTDRDSNETFSMNSFFGLPEKINGILPQGATMSPAVDVTRNSSVNGSGNLKREENLTLRLAARVVDVLPNGYLRLSGKQEIIVNNEIRYLQITGLARTQDITRQNIITYDKIAEARIFYGGQGQISNELRAKRGEKFIRKVVPF